MIKGAGHGLQSLRDGGLHWSLLGLSLGRSGKDSNNKDEQVIFFFSGLPERRFWDSHLLSYFRHSHLYNRVPDDICTRKNTRRDKKQLRVNLKRTIYEEKC